MGLVERVFCKIDHLVIDLIRNLLINPVLYAPRYIGLFIAIDKDLPLPAHHIPFFLGHGTPQQVAPPHGVACQIPDDLHDLLLIDDAAIGGRQDGLQLGAVIYNGSRPVLPLDILGDKIHRPRTVQGDPRDDILQAVRL